MLNLFLRLFGRRVAHRAVARHTRGGGILDTKFGFALLRDRRIPPGLKLFSLGLGMGLMALLIGMELPLEGLWALLLPPLALPLDFAIDGLEAVIGPLLIASLLLPHLAPKALVSRLRAERNGLDTGPVIDVESREPFRSGRKWRLAR
jgi:hypothetical protein